MTVVSFKSIIIIASVLVCSNCRIISTQDRENNRYFEDINKMIEEIHHEEIMREIDEEHFSIIDDIHLEDIKHLKETLNYELNILQESFQLPNI